MTAPVAASARWQRNCYGPVPDLGLRAETDADFEFLCALYASVREEEMAPVPWPAEAKLAFLRDQFTQQSVHYRQHYPGAELLVIERGGASAGRIYLYRSGQEIRLMDVALVASLRGQGIGTRLIQALLAAADAAACQVTLHVEPTNPAQRLYQRFGFSPDRGARPVSIPRPRSDRVNQLNTAS